MVMIPFFNILPPLGSVWTVVAYKPAFFPFSFLEKERVPLECWVEASPPALWEQWDGVSLRVLVVM